MDKISILKEVQNKMAKTKFRKSFKGMSTHQIRTTAGVLKKFATDENPVVKERYKEYKKEIKRRKKPVYDDVVGYGVHKVN